MSKSEKLLNKLKQSKNTFVWLELVTILKHLGYQKKERAGSRVLFYNEKTKHIIKLHKPHPENFIKGGALKDIKTALKQERLL